MDGGRWEHYLRSLLGVHWFPLKCVWKIGESSFTDVVRRKGAIAGSLDGWGWRILSKVEEIEVWPEGLLDAHIAMIPGADGDATPLGQRPLSVLPVVCRIWSSAWMVQLDDWFRSWVPDSVFSAGGGRSWVESWYTTALDIEEVLSVAADSDIHLFVADVIKYFDTVDRED